MIIIKSNTDLMYKEATEISDNELRQIAIDNVIEYINNLDLTDIAYELKDNYGYEVVIHEDKIMSNECGYCGALVRTNNLGLLCDECQMTFGHSTIDEL